MEIYHFEQTLYHPPKADKSAGATGQAEYLNLGILDILGTLGISY
jgi:hypothetical protein